MCVKERERERERERARAKERVCVIVIVIFIIIYVYIYTYAGQHHWPWETRPAQHDSRFLDKDVPMPWDVWCTAKKDTR